MIAAPRRLYAAVLLGAIALAACQSPAPAPSGGAASPAAPSGGTGGAAATPAALTPLRVASSGISGNVMVPWAAFEGGYFQKYGLAVDGVPDIAASTTAVQTLLARDVDVININPNPAIEASLKGGPGLLALANTPPGTGFWLYAAPGTRSVEDLRGKAVAANQAGSLTYFAVDYALRQRGLQAGKDFDVLSIGNQAAQLAAIEKGDVLAAVLSLPTSAAARKAGLVQLMDLNDVPINANGPIVRRDALDDAAGRDALMRYLKASLEAIARLRQDRAFADEIMAKYLQVTDPEVRDEVYAVYLPKRVPLVNVLAVEAALENIAQRDPAARGADPHRFYDNGPIEELERSGFIDTLYR